MILLDSEVGFQYFQDLNSRLQLMTGVSPLFSTFGRISLTKTLELGGGRISRFQKCFLNGIYFLDWALKKHTWMFLRAQQAALNVSTEPFNSTIGERCMNGLGTYYGTFISEMEGNY